MRRHLPLALSIALLALAGLAAAPAMADGGRHGGHHRHHHDDRHDRGHRGRGHDDHRRWNGHSRWYRGDPRRVVYVGPPAPSYVVRHRPVYRGPHYGPPPWVRGHHYGYHGYAPTYVVHDYRPYRLHAPPRGYYWRRSDAGDFLLVAIATGIITDIVLRH